MPGSTVDRALITQFSDMLHVQAQQIRARLRPFTRIKQMTGDVFAYDGLGQVEAQEAQGRIVKKEFNDIEHLRRKIARRRFYVSLPIDDSDVRGMLLNPEGEYAEACIRAMERRYDRTVIEAMFADVLTGRDFDTTVTYANDGGNTVDATSGLTYEKLLEIKRFWTDNEVGNDIPETFVLGISGDEEEDLFLESELISGDFTRQFVIESGRMARALDMALVKYGASVNNPLLPVASSTRDCFAMTARAMCVGMSKDMSISINERNEYLDTDEVEIVGIWGAVRTEGKLIQKVQTTE